MKKIFSYPLSAIHYLLFLLFLCVFHPLQWFTFKVFGYAAHKKTVDILNWFLLGTLTVLGTRFKFSFEEELPTDVPLIFASNHQSAYEICALTWMLRKYHAKFVSKKELGKNIPSVSFNLKYGGSVLIDRKDPKQALSALAKFGKRLEKNKWSGIIFPEGTRSKTGKPKKFSVNGLKVLSKYAPSAYVVPVTINDSWKLVKNGSFPLSLGITMRIHAHKPIAVNSMDFNELFEKVEETVKNSVNL